MKWRASVITPSEIHQDINRKSNQERITRKVDQTYPDNRIYRITPTDHISLEAETSCLERASGET